MKKHLKGLFVAAVAVFALFGAGITVALASGYVVWGGSDNYGATIEIFANLGRGIDELQGEITDLESEKAVLKRDNSSLASRNTDLVAKNEELNRVIEEKDNQIANSTPDSEIVARLSSVISESNGVNGPKNKYDVIQTHVNGLAETYGIDERLGSHGNSAEDAQLEQAEKDMRHVREEAEKLESKLRGEQVE